MNVDNFFDFVVIIVFIYPGVMAIHWTVMGLIYFWKHERHMPVPTYQEGQPAPKVAILIPCFNEAKHLRESIPYFQKLHYPQFDLVFINDGSTDETAVIIDEWANQYSNIHALHKSNGGKASALNMALAYVDAEYVICVDADAILDEWALDYMVQRLSSDASIGGVTGNPRVRNRSTLLGRLQVAEFSSIIGLIKRAQSLMGTLFTVSGVICGFKAAVLKQVGGWSTNMITDDIDISWKVQRQGYSIAYEPRALCWVLMPETFKGFYKQRLRWAQGGAEVVFRYMPFMFGWKNRRFWPLYQEYCLTALWCYSLIALTIFSLLNWALVSQQLTVGLLQINSVLLLAFFMFQFSISLYIDNHYEKGLSKYFFSSIWYPYAYWVVNLVTLAIGLPKALIRNRNKQAVWKSPDRGV
ncbi:poly-beta-1,6-N-acetyl-D-glucosamine synthase [Snodgrassella sp. CFCC 13594]|uniref:poly-beta-1,6-N-acetyl-D-glucosamine synthase n=1 Tax=Snodgrassella sp. CFCC 13594 TaxID=1775559 RepID=UPI0008295476|nr:poly-beta-1,6-N-acetyl-D-glucosamine synthase [Snodgrassella sp. CFCC 13594]